MIASWTTPDAHPAHGSDDDEDDYYEHEDEMIQLDYENNEFIGDILQEEKPSSVTRLYCQNLNGIKWDKEGGNWPATCEAISSIHADISCFTELNHDVNRHIVREKLREINGRFFDHHRFVTGTSSRKTTRTYKPGGTGMLVVHDTSGIVQDTSKDRMGRWVSTRLLGANETTVNVIAAYQVCQTTATGVNTAASQQVSHLTEENATQGDLARINPRNAFIRDLQQFIHQQQQNGDRIILVGDFNEEIDSANSGMAQIASECGLADLFSARLGTSTVPNTHQSGHKRIDYALISPDLLPAVQAAGYDPIGYRLTSDHRGFFVDFETQRLFGNKPSPIVPFSKRDFNSRTPGAIPTYITAKIKELDSHNFQERLQRLIDLETPDHRLAESLDHDMERAAKHAAKKAKRGYRTPWSPLFAEAWATIRYTKLIVSKFRNPHVNYDAVILDWQQKHTYLPADLPPDLAHARAGYQAALRQLRNARHQASLLREQYLDDKAKMYAHMEEHGKARIVQRLKQAEAIHRTYQKLQAIRRRDGSAGGISSLRVPIDPNVDPKQCPPSAAHWRTERAPEEIERLLLDRNRAHFGQAAGTPLTAQGIATQLPYNGDGPAADLILAGEFDASDLDATTQLFINHLRKKTATQLPATITTEDFVGKIKHWPETTSTSPSGIHLGHYHALVRHHGLSPDNPRAAEVEAGQEFLIKAHVALLQYALKFGYHYDRWTAVVNVMLLKDAGDPKIHRLRVIHLYEADYNLLLAVKWRQSMHHAEDNALLNDGLYGSRAGRSAHEPVFLEVLQNDIYMTSMKSGINFDLDATSCYDRILAAIASIASRRMGMARHVVLVNANTLQEAKFKLKTSLGISSGWYQHCHAFPIHGTGQGSGNSPQIWCFICSVLFDAFASVTNGATFVSHNGKNALTIHMVGFVDDCTQRVNDFCADVQPSADELCERMRHDAQTWNNLLWSSGGALEISKCSFHLIQSEWRNDGTPFLKAGRTAPPITLFNGLIPSQVRQKSNYESHKTLGCHVNPANRMATQKKHLQQKSDKEANIITCNVLTVSEARTYYVSMYLPSMTYPFPITCLRAADCDDIQNRFMQVIVRNSGFNSHMHLAIRYAPLHFGGAGFRRLYIEQGLLQILMAVKHLRSPSGQPGRLLRIALSWAQAYVGTSDFLWTNPSKATPCHPAAWINSVTEFLASIHASIHLPPESDIVPPLLRQRDKYLMELAISQGYSDRVLDRINSCRRFLQVITIADIADAIGTRLLPGIMDGSMTSNRHTMTTELFNQARPYSPAWLSWRNFLRTFSDPNGRLHQSLREWIVPHDICRRRSTYVHDPVTDTLYLHRDREQYQALAATAPGRYQCIDLVNPTTAAQGYPVYAIDTGQDHRPILNYQVTAQQPIVVLTGTFGEMIASLSDWESQLLSHLELLFDPHTIIQHLNEGKFKVATDGSVITVSGTFGYVCVSHNGVRLFRGRGPAPGSRPQSFRAEGYGALAIYRLLFRLAQYTGSPITSEFSHLIDSTSVIKRIEKHSKWKYHVPNATMAPEWDLIEMIVQSRARLTDTTSKLVWVKGHQDEARPRATLSLSAQLNCEADDQASQFQLDHGQEIPCAPMLPSTQAQLQIQGESISSYYKTRIRDAATIPKLMKYYEKLFNWTPDTQLQVDWPVYKQILRNHQKQQTTLVKHLHLIAPTGDIAHRNNHHYPAGCPCCDNLTESNDHVLLCPGDSRRTWRTKLQTSIITTTNTTSSDPVLADILRDGLTRWLNGLPEIEHDQYPANYHILIQSQNNIGWSHLFRARWSIHWQRLHREYGARTHLDKKEADGLAWVRKLGSKLLQHWFELWDVRNKERHGKDAEEQKAKRLMVLRSQLTELYEWRPLTMPSDRHMYYPTVEHHLNAHPNLDQIEDWIGVWTPALKASMAQARTVAA